MTDKINTTESSVVQSTPTAPTTYAFSSSDDPFKVEIVGPRGAKVVFEASVPVTESRMSSYAPYDITHLPTSLWAYKNTSGRKFSVQGRLVSRTPREAQQNAQYLDLIRTWILPDFGDTGATPPHVKLSGFRNNNLTEVQCVIVSYSFNFPEDVDFIYTSEVPMPVIAALTVELEEVYSADQITKNRWRLGVARDGAFENGPDNSLIKNDSGVFSEEGFNGLASSSVGGIVGAAIGSIGGSILGKLGGLAGGARSTPMGKSILSSSQLIDGAIGSVNNSLAAAARAPNPLQPTKLGSSQRSAALPPQRMITD